MAVAIRIETVPDLAPHPEEPCYPFLNLDRYPELQALYNEFQTRHQRRAHLERLFEGYDFWQKLESGRQLAGEQNPENPLWEPVYREAAYNHWFYFTVLHTVNHDTNWIEAANAELPRLSKKHFLNQGYMYGIECPFPRRVGWTDTTL